jgi:16S rRNA (guanine(966)-N(2))-methyltransferase RsmD
MRVIAGTARGRRLKELQGRDTRPTTDKVKESIFNIIQFELEGRRVLDLFGGTGQLGIEALSRGSAHCTFVEMRRDAVNLMRDNLKELNFTDRAKIVQGDALAFLSSCREKFDVILLDPPYHGDLMDQAMEAIIRFDILSEHGIMVCETSADRQLTPPPAEKFEEGRSYRYGQIKLSIFRRKGKNRDA